jgi:predicted PhzF superfamily epimerase YddE/YHI9
MGVTKMASKTFFLFDVFAIEKYGGNGLAVFRDAVDSNNKDACSHFLRG